MIWKENKVLVLELKIGDYIYLNSSEIVFFSTGHYPIVRIITTAHTHNEIYIDSSIGKNVENLEYIIGNELRFNNTDPKFIRPKTPISKQNLGI